MQPLQSAPFNLAPGSSPSEISFMYGKSLETHDWWANPSLTRAKEKMRTLNRWRYKSTRPCYKIIHPCTLHSGDPHHRNMYWWLLHHKRNDYGLRNTATSLKRGWISQIQTTQPSGWSGSWDLLSPLTKGLATNGVDFLPSVPCLSLRSVGRCASANSVFQWSSQRCGGDGRKHDFLSDTQKSKYCRAHLCCVFKSQNSNKVWDYKQKENVTPRCVVSIQKQSLVCTPRRAGEGVQVSGVILSVFLGALRSWFWYWRDNLWDNHGSFLDLTTAYYIHVTKGERESWSWATYNVFSLARQIL